MPGQHNAVAEAVDEGVLDGLRTTLGPAGDRVLTQMIRLFLDGVPATMTAIRSAAGSGDADGLARSAHRLRGDAATMGAAGLGTLCAKAEMLGWAGDLTAAGELVESIAGELARVESALRLRQAAA